MRALMRVLAFVATMLTLQASMAQSDSLPTVESTDTLLAGVPEATKENLKRVTFTTDVVNREPVDGLDSLDITSNKVLFFTEIVDFEGGQISHRWIHNGETMAVVLFSIHGPRWRVYSSKNLMPQQTGTWTVEVLDGQENVIQQATLIYENLAEPTRTSMSPGP